MKTKSSTSCKRGAMASTLLLAALVPAQAAEWEVSGQIRQEIAVKTTNDQNPMNQYGNVTNGLVVPNAGDAVLQAFGLPANPNAPTRPASYTEKANINSFATRLELNFDGKISESLKATIKVRGITEQVDSVDNVFKNKSKNAGTNANSFYEQQTPAQLSYADKNTLIDLPAAYLDYNDGPLWIRGGNQQIAWGEAIFFRVADVPNGLDLRGHLFDPAAEEYSNTRRSALGLRASYRANEKFDVEGFTQMARPSLLPNGETPYNVIADQFTVHESQGYEDMKDKLNFGLRMRGEGSGFGFQAFAVNRINPDGVYHWTQATGAGAIPGSAFEAGTSSGVYNHTDWFSSASASRLDGIGGLNAALNATSGGTAGLSSAIAGACGATNATPGQFNVGSQAAASCVLDTFFGAQGNLRGHLAREFHRETVLGFGVNKVFTGEPDSFTDQLIGRFELSYTPNKVFTNPTLGDPIVKNETAFAFIAEKYHKFASDIPATYIVAQWMHKTQSDIFGRYLGGVDNQPGSVPNGQSGGFNAVALAIQQPSPTLLYRFDFTVLTDLKGGYYVQPGVRWKPTKSFTGDLYLNILHSQNPGQAKDFADGLQHNNEIFARASWQF